MENISIAKNMNIVTSKDKETDEVKLKWEFLPLTIIAEKAEEDIPPQGMEKVPQYVIDHCRKLLSIAGRKVCIFYWEIELEDITLKQGEIINYTKIIKKRGGEEHRCHQNSAKLWLKDPGKYKLITGYALSSGIWISHTWLLDSKVQINETTIPRELYYGVILDTQGSEEFCKTVLSEN